MGRYLLSGESEARSPHRFVGSGCEGVAITFLLAAISLKRPIPVAYLHNPGDSPLTREWDQETIFLPDPSHRRGEKRRVLSLVPARDRWRSSQFPP
jgi:hypothetical protein